MKKAFSLALAWALALSLTACGGGTPSQGGSSSGGADLSQVGASSSQGGASSSQSGPEEAGGGGLDELLAQAEEIDLRQLAEEHFKALPEVTGQLGGKVVKITGSFSIDSSSDDLFFSGGYAPGDGSVNDAGIASAEVKIRMDLSEEDQARVKEDIANMYRVAIVGRIGEGMTEESYTSKGLKDGQDILWENRIYCYTMSEAYFVTDTFEYTGTLDVFGDGEYGITYSDGTGGHSVHFREGEEIPPAGTEITISSKYVGMGGMGHMDAVIVR